MSLSLKNTMLATTALCLILALSAGGAEKTSVAKTVPNTRETALVGPTVSEGGFVVELPDAYQANLTVDITIKDNQLTDIIITGHNGTQEFSEQAIQVDQSTDVEQALAQAELK